MGVDLALVPRAQDAFYVGEVFIEGGTANPGLLRNAAMVRVCRPSRAASSAVRSITAEATALLCASIVSFQSLGMARTVTWPVGRVDTYCLDIATVCLDQCAVWKDRIMGDSRIKAGAMPGWVKVFIGIGIAVLVVLAVATFSGHGPWQHMGVSGMY